MSDNLTPRDVIARDLHQICVDRWNQYDGASTRHGVEVHHKTADVAVAALDAAGIDLVPRTDTGPTSQGCGIAFPYGGAHPAHKYMLNRKIRQCPGVSGEVAP